MKMYRTIIMLIVCILLLLPLSASHALSIRDNTYLVFIRNPEGSSLLSIRWADQFEFDAGDVYRAYTTEEGELTGTWIETELFDGPFFSLTWFQAYVQKSEETTTTTSIPTDIETRLTESSFAPQQIKFDISIWGIASTAFITIPDPVTPTILGFSIMSGYGNYLGNDTTFLGFAGVTGTGGGGGVGDPAFGSIAPNEGEQESTVLNIEITCDNTTFNDDGVNDIIFIPPDGLTVNSIAVQDNTTVEFDLEIAADAPLGEKTVIVSWDDPPQTLASDSVSKFFTVK